MKKKKIIKRKSKKKSIKKKKGNQVSIGKATIQRKKKEEVINQNLEERSIHQVVRKVRVAKVEAEIETENIGKKSIFFIFYKKKIVFFIFLGKKDIGEIKFK